MYEGTAPVIINIDYREAKSSRLFRKRSRETLGTGITATATTAATTTRTLLSRRTGISGNSGIREMASMHRAGIANTTNLSARAIKRTKKFFLLLHRAYLF
ncbi:hypothetical protein PUN28_007371 [Cardiocondyla obscurior]|uniref:Uncharacterized protein n=1 Tax=Cardiocondyla obscurior TaxID=286306 RepID=A0AAW2G5V2_9HYME